MNILLVHGVGHCDSTDNYYDTWKSAIAENLKSFGYTDAIAFEELHYDALFDEHYHGTGAYLAALGELAAAGAWHSIVDPINELLHPSRGFGDDLRWSAGMVAQLCVEDELRAQLRDVLAKAIAAQQPDIIAAHSLGTLVTYDFLHNDKRGRAAATNTTYITFGSQINNPFARSRLFPGPIKVPSVRFWYHLYNDQDHVLTAPINISDPKFLQVPTPSAAGHNPIGSVEQPGYLQHPNTQNQVWRSLATRGKS